MSDGGELDSAAGAPDSSSRTRPAHRHAASAEVRLVHPALHVRQVKLLHVSCGPLECDVSIHLDLCMLSRVCLCSSHAYIYRQQPPPQAPDPSTKASPRAPGLSARQQIQQPSPDASSPPSVGTAGCVKTMSSIDGTVSRIEPVARPCSTTRPPMHERHPDTRRSRGPRTPTELALHTPPDNEDCGGGASRHASRFSAETRNEARAWRLAPPPQPPPCMRCIRLRCVRWQAAGEFLSRLIEEGRVHYCFPSEPVLPPHASLAPTGKHTTTSRSAPCAAPRARPQLPHA